MYISNIVMDSFHYVESINMADVPISQNDPKASNCHGQLDCMRNDCTESNFAQYIMFAFMSR